MADEAKWKEAFDNFDTDGSGAIQSSELVGLLEGLLGDHDKAISAGADLLAECDKDGDKKITWDEFKAAMEKSC